MKAQNKKEEMEKGIFLTNQELSGLIEACNVANRHDPRPPWKPHGIAAWGKLVKEERIRSQSLPSN